MPSRIIFLVFTLMIQTQSPWFGTWKQNFEKSTTNRDSRYKRVVLEIIPTTEGLKVTYDMVGTRGGVTHMEWTGKFDGKDYSVQGVDYVLTNAYTMVNNNSYQIVAKLDGVIVATAKVTVSPDGKTLTSVTTEKNASGETVSTTSVYDRL